ncbi:uncharacterized protein VDAG_05291 [Verticillium dahliae VdLs.17]|uniref:Transmembrane protein n=1 Tax=Verticillium dahliae (strain VdLs.17 / ATCC MYA-4575 / FGSC 10137) TaxID=498257 RepID=G2X559_VERDV|nr:uncharacterized protein VDAG_05291 [Verticillium dahliae VdLs.17]EGY23853.1 hypothetical protein VDAG_05291 [Verticillium dahliae VdLs.17]
MGIAPNTSRKLDRLAATHHRIPQFVGPREAWKTVLKVTEGLSIDLIQELRDEATWHIEAIDDSLQYIATKVALLEAIEASDLRICNGRESSEHIAVYLCTPNRVMHLPCTVLLLHSMHRTTSRCSLTVPVPGSNAMALVANEATPLLGGQEKRSRLTSSQMLALLVFLLTLVICILGHFLPLVLLFYTSTNEAWVERITIATPYFLDSLWDYSVELVLDYTSFEALRKDAAPTSATDVEATIDPREAKVDLTEAATDLTEVTTKPKEAAIGPMQRTIRKSDAPNAFLKGFLLKVPSIIAMSATNLQTQMCFLYALLISVLVAVVLGLGFYLIFSPQAKSTQHAKAARDDAT